MHERILPIHLRRRLMNQPTENRFTSLEDRLKRIEGYFNDWQDWKFITRDSSHKIGVAEGLTLSLQQDVTQVKVDLAHVARTVDNILAHQIEADGKLDQILQLLQPRGRE
jgi:hypothetical protein